MPRVEGFSSKGPFQRRAVETARPALALPGGPSPQTWIHSRYPPLLRPGGPAWGRGAGHGVLVLGAGSQFLIAAAQAGVTEPAAGIALRAGSRLWGGSGVMACGGRVWWKEEEKRCWQAVLGTPPPSRLRGAQAR